jgi:hypothetical protein
MDSCTGHPVWCSRSRDSRNAVIVGLELEAKALGAASGEHCPSVYVSGPGDERARIAAARAIDAGARGLISFGLAGGLLPEAAPGTVVLPATIVSEAGEWRVDAPWHDGLKRALAPRFRMIEASVFSSAAVVTTPLAKAALAARTGAAAVDMESAAVASTAAAAGLPFVAVRVVADGPEDALPESVDDLVTADGRTRYLGLPPYLVSPRRLRLLIRLAGRSRRARAELARVVQVLAGSGR